MPVRPATTGRLVSPRSASSRSVLFATALVAAALLVAVPPAGASTPSAGSVGNDVSYPQCGMSLPSWTAFGIVGVNNGHAYSTNPCLAQQLAWAKRAQNHGPSFYANTGNPGPAFARHWPYGQTSPRVCQPSNPNSSSCAFDYGWNAAKQSLGSAIDAVARLDGVTRQDAFWRATAVPWWLDVETMNSWQNLEAGYGPSYQAKLNDTAALSGAVRALWDAGITRVGIYSTSFQWRQITGGRAYTHDFFHANPVWLAGYNDANDALSGCWDSSFTGGPVLMTQYLGATGFDANLRCR